MSKRRTEKRFALLKAQNGKCYWCGCEMALRYSNGSRRKLPDDEVTIDHLDDKFSPDRGNYGGEIRQVGSCSKCNHNRGKNSVAAQPIETLRERSKRHT